MNQRKVILFISHSAGLYGAEAYLVSLVSGLDRNRFQPIVVLPGNGPLQTKLEELNVSVEVVPSIRGWLTRRRGIQGLLHFIAVIPFVLISAWRIRRIIFRRQVDLVHTNSSVVIDGALAARASGIPHIWHARELLIPETIFNFVFGPQVALSLIKRLSDWVVASSRGVKQTFRQQDDCSKVVVVYDGIELGMIQPIQAETLARTQLGIPEDSLLVGEVGKVIAIKGYDDFVKAADTVRRTIPNVAFIGVGGVSRSDIAYEQRIMELIDKYSLQGSFKLLGHRDDVACIMGELDLLVLPSHIDAFPRVLLEAMAASKPVVGTRVGGIPEIIEEGVTGLLVSPCSPSDLAQAIIKILKNPDLARRMGTAGRERVNAYFSAERYVTEIQEIYEELLG
jgi:glycosyltransferase involved in cell wall biosynthesis